MRESKIGQLWVVVDEMEMSVHQKSHGEKYKFVQS